MYSDGSASEFNPVYNDVIVLSQYLLWILSKLEGFNFTLLPWHETTPDVALPELIRVRFQDRRSKRVMARVPAILLFVEAQQREVDNPKKIETIRRNQE